jgi:hypothetical protein
VGFVFPVVFVFDLVLVAVADVPPVLFPDSCVMCVLVF